MMFMDNKNEVRSDWEGLGPDFLVGPKLSPVGSESTVEPEELEYESYHIVDLTLAAW